MCVSTHLYTGSDGQGDKGTFFITKYFFKVIFFKKKYFVPGSIYIYPHTCIQVVMVKGYGNRAADGAGVWSIYIYMCVCVCVCVCV